MTKMVKSFIKKIVLVQLVLSFTVYTPNAGGSTETNDKEIFVMELSKPPYSKGESSGVDYLQLKGMSLKTILIRLFPVDIHVFTNDLAEFKFDFEYKGDLSDKKSLREKIHARLVELLKVNVEDTVTYVDRYSLEYALDQNDSNCETKAVIDKITKINRLWIGECVSLDQVASHISEVFDVTVEAVKPDLRLKKIEIHYDDFSTVQEYLKFDKLNLSAKHSKATRYSYGF